MVIVSRGTLFACLQAFGFSMRLGSFGFIACSQCVYGSPRDDMQWWSRSRIVLGATKLDNGDTSHIHFLGGQGLLRVWVVGCQGPWLMFTVENRSFLWLLALGSAMITCVGSVRCVRPLAVVDRGRSDLLTTICGKLGTMTYGGLRGVSFLCKWFA